MNQDDRTPSTGARTALTVATLAIAAVVLLALVGVDDWTVAVVAALSVMTGFDAVRRHRMSPRSQPRTWNVEVAPTVRVRRVKH
jgi:rRNA maturation protein Rpf1